MALIPNVYKKDMAGLNQMLAVMGDDEFVPTLSLVLTVDFAYHNEDNDYADGLSFLDRIYWKLKRFHPEWIDVQDLKVRIQDAEHPVEEYMDVLNELFADQSDINYYGI